MTLTPKREQEIRHEAEKAWLSHSPQAFYVLMLRDLLAEMDALRAAGDKLAERVESWGLAGSSKDAVALAGWREARRG